MNRTIRGWTTTTLLLALLLAGCAVGPDYQRPGPLASGAPLPDRFKEAAVPMQPAQPADTVERGAWWAVFRDPLLDEFMTRLHAANQDLASAEARYRQAVAARDQARAALWPNVAASSSATRSKSGNGSATGTVSVGLAAAWEVDLWGRVRRTVEAGTATMEAAAADRAAIQLSLEAQLASTYALLRVVDAQQALLDETVRAYERSLQVTNNRYAAGVASRLDVVQAEAQLQTARAQAIDIGVQRTALEHALAALIGQAPAEFSLEARPRLPLTMPAIPSVLASQVLERRPGGAAAERRMAAANAQIGVAASAYFPALTLDASGGYRGPSVSDLFTVPHQVWSLGPTLALTLFDGGARQARTEQARAAYDQTVADYRQTVLIALKETEDNLAALRLLEQEIREQQLAVTASTRAAELAFNQYKAGTVSYLGVAVLQAAALTAQRNALILQGDRATATIALINAIGGGW